MRIGLLCLAASLSCSSAVILPNRLASLACSAKTVAANKISCDGAVVAEVRCEGSHGHSCKALLMRYPGGGRTVLYRSPDFDLDKPGSYVTLSKGGYFQYALYPTLAPDGSKVWFKEYTPAGGSWREYDLAAGRLRDIDESRLWEQLHFEYRDRDIPISGEISR